MCFLIVGVMVVMIIIITFIHNQTSIIIIIIIIITTTIPCTPSLLLLLIVIMICFHHDRDASRDDVERAYQSLAMKYHPALTQEPDAQDMLREVGHD